jgi:hypothetical protein
MFMGRQLQKTSLLLCLLFTACAPLHAESAATARAAVDPVIEAAKQWHTDAILTNVSAVEVAPDGTAEAWDYLFYSPSFSRYGRITARMVAGGGFTVKETSKGPKEAVPADFADSDRALATARWNGLNLRSSIMGLTSRGWAVYRGLKRGDAIIWVDARTAAYIRTEIIPKK